jgi:hypothetical protein
MPLRDLDQIAARIVEHRRGHRPHGGRRLGEVYAGGAQSRVLRLHVFDAEGRVGNAILLDRGT